MKIKRNSKTHLNAEEFLSIWKGEKTGDPNYSDFYKEDWIMLSQSNNEIHHGEKRKWVIFRNIIVTGFINLIDDNVTYPPINISGCIFQDRFNIQKGIFENFIIGLNGGENIFLNGLHIINGEFKNHAQISGLGKVGDPKPTELNIHGGIFPSKLRIWSAYNCKLEITNGEYIGGLSLYGNFFDIKISGGTYYSNLEFETLYCENDIQIIGDARSKVRILDSDWGEDGFPKFTKFINAGIVVLGQIVVRRVLSISYIRCDFFKFSISRSDKLKNYDCFIDELHFIDFSSDIFIPSKDGVSIIINSLTFEGCTTISSSIVQLDYISTNKLTFERQITVGNFIISGLLNSHIFICEYSGYYNNQPHLNPPKFIELLEKKIIRSQLIVKLSDLGSSKFFNCDLSETDIIFDSSLIFHMYLIGTEMPPEIKNTNNDYTQIKIGYSQLKKAYLNIGDEVSANKYLIQETLTLKAQLKKNPNSKKDMFILWLNNLSTKHGQDWVRGLCFTCISGFLFFLLYVIVIPGRPFNWGWNGIGQFWDASLETIFFIKDYYLEFLYPGHSFMFITENYHGLPLLIDIIGRIVIGYGVYQTIQAFRKFKVKI